MRTVITYHIVMLSSVELTYIVYDTQKGQIVYVNHLESMQSKYVD
jgi:hypothetical protein